MNFLFAIGHYFRLGKKSVGKIIRKMFACCCVNHALPHNFCALFAFLRKLRCVKANLLFFLVLTIFSLKAYALTFALPNTDDTVVGRTRIINTIDNMDITDYGVKYQIGYLEFKESNRNFNIDNLHEGEQLVVPNKYILPDAPHEGTVINLPELRVYYYPKDKNEVLTFPVGIGREGADTPVVETTIIAKYVKPNWIPPKVARDIALKEGIVLPKMIPPGPDNPLGEYAMRFSFLDKKTISPTYLMHGTNDPSGVGKRSSAGCIRMYPNDMKELFQLIKIGDKVTIINKFAKAGWKGDKLYLEVHSPIDKKDKLVSYNDIIYEVSKILIKQTRVKLAQINWNKVITVAKKQNGIPEVVGCAYHKPEA